MWLILAFCSAALLGLYDVCKKKALLNNAVLPVLFFNTVICSLIFIPFIVLSSTTNVLDGTVFYVEQSTWAEHKYIILKACIVLSSWVFGYFAMKHLPITIVGPINATRPVMVLVGAMLVFGERLNVWQWIGVLLAIVSFFLLSRSGKKEVSTSLIIAGYSFLLWPLCLALSADCTTSILWLRLRMGEWD